MLRVSCFITLALIATLPVARADTPAFTSQITADNSHAAGLNRLSPEQVAVLNALVQRDIDAAIAGKTVAFAKTFTARRTAEEMKQSGIDLLTPAERERLDVLVASAIANRPGVTYTYETTPTSGPTGHVLSERTSAIVHGEVSLFVGGGSGGRSWYGGSVETSITDPSRHLTVIVGASEIKGRGVRPCYYDGRIW